MTEKILCELLVAWESLPGGRNYSKSIVQDWLVKDMVPAIDKAREVLGIKPGEAQQKLQRLNSDD